MYVRVICHLLLCVTALPFLLLLVLGINVSYNHGFDIITRKMFGTHHRLVNANLINIKISILFILTTLVC